MHELIEPFLRADHAIVEAAAALRWGPLTVLFVLVSAWWVKGPLFVAAGCFRDVRGRCAPVTGLAVVGAVLLASLCSTVLKDAFDRDRPPVADPDFAAAVSVPGSPSFPSGHALTAFAGAVVLAMLVPRLRRPALAVACAVAVSRVYLGVHYALDVLAGAALGAAIGFAVATAVRALAPSPGRSGRSGPSPRAGRLSGELLATSRTGK